MANKLHQWLQAINMKLGFGKLHISSGNLTGHITKWKASDKLVVP